MVFIDVGLFRVHLLSRVDINLLCRGRFYIWSSGLHSLNRGFRYIEVRSICCVNTSLRSNENST